MDSDGYLSRDDLASVYRDELLENGWQDEPDLSEAVNKTMCIIMDSVKPRRHFEGGDFEIMFMELVKCAHGEGIEKLADLLV